MTIPKAMSVLCFFTSPSLARAFDTHAHSNAGPSAGPLQLFCAVLHLRPENVYCPCVEAINCVEGERGVRSNGAKSECECCERLRPTISITYRSVSSVGQSMCTRGAPGYGCSMRRLGFRGVLLTTYVSAKSVGADECTIGAHAGGSTEGVLDDYPSARAAVPPLIEDTWAFLAAGIGVAAFPSAGGQQERHEEEKVGRDHYGHSRCRDVHLVVSILHVREKKNRSLRAGLSLVRDSN